MIKKTNQTNNKEKLTILHFHYDFLAGKCMCVKKGVKFGDENGKQEIKRGKKHRTKKQKTKEMKKTRKKINQKPPNPMCFSSNSLK